MEVNDCFLMRGEKITDPMTVYCITDINEGKMWMKRLYVGDDMVQGWPTSSTSAESIPEEAIPLPPDSWKWGKRQMLSFLDEIYAYLKENVTERKSKFDVGEHYIGHGGIHTVKEIGSEKIKHRLFRLDEDDISPIWTGEVPLNDIEDRYAVSEEVYNEVMHRYNKLLMRLRERFCKCNNVQ